MLTLLTLLLFAGMITTTMAQQPDKGPVFEPIADLVFDTFDGKGFAPYPDGSSTLESTLMGVELLDLIGALDDDQWWVADEVAAYVKSLQDQGGGFSEYTDQARSFQLLPVHKQLNPEPSFHTTDFHGNWRGVRVRRKDTQSTTGSSGYTKREYRCNILFDWADNIENWTGRHYSEESHPPNHTLCFRHYLSLDFALGKFAKRHRTCNAPPRPDCSECHCEYGCKRDTIQSPRGPSRWLGGECQALHPRTADMVRT